MAGFGAVFLVVVGVLLPVVFGLLLWRNKDRLSDPIFSTKVGQGFAVMCLTTCCAQLQTGVLTWRKTLSSALYAKPSARPLVQQLPHLNKSMLLGVFRLCIIEA